MDFPLALSRPFDIGANTLHFIPYQSYNAALVINACYEYVKTLDADNTLDIYAGTWSYMRPFLCDITLNDDDPSVAALRHWLHAPYATLADDFSAFCYLVDIELLASLMEGYNTTRKDYRPAPVELSAEYRDSTDPN